MNQKQPTPTLQQQQTSLYMSDQIWNNGNAYLSLENLGKLQTSLIIITV